MYLRQQHYSRCHLLVRLGQRIAWSHPFPVSCGDRGIITSQPVPFCSSVSLCSAYCKGVGVCARNTPCPQSASLVVPARCRCSGRVSRASKSGRRNPIASKYSISRYYIQRSCHEKKPGLSRPGSIRQLTEGLLFSDECAPEHSLPIKQPPDLCARCACPERLGRQRSMPDEQAKQEP